MNDSATATLAPLLPVILLTLIAVAALLRHWAARQRQARALLWLQALKKLTAHLQRHRGLVVAVQCGDELLQPVLQDMQHQISNDLAQVEACAGYPREDPQWQAVTAHWARLSGRALGLSVPQSLDQHTRLIQSLVALIDGIACQYRLAPATEGTVPVWRVLLELAEQLGHVRALGVLIIVRGDTAPAFGGAAARVVLARAIQAILDRLQASSMEAPLPAELLQQVLGFLQRVEVELLRTAAPPCSAEEFFVDATAVINQLYAQFDLRLAELGRRLLG